MDLNRYIINPKDQVLTIQIIIDRIEKGFQLQELTEDNLTESDLIEFNDSIIIAPDYQRDYRSTVKDESSLIESVLVGIPIPPIFMANDLLNSVQVMNVIDGQHRLRAFYRFCQNKYKLSDLTILHDFSGLKYDDLTIDIKRRLLSKEISIIIFKDFPGSEFEIEIFNRYNKGTKPLTPQEIRHAVYNSEFNQYVNRFSQKLFKHQSILSKAYNVTKDRLQKKKLQECIFVILSILESGIDPTISKSPHYAEFFMKQKSELEKKKKESFDIKYEKIKDRFECFNQFIMRLIDFFEYPFSKELYGISNRNYKFQISLAMILAGIFHKVIDSGYELSSIPGLIDYDMFVIYIDNLLNNSFLEDPSYSASSTNSIELIKLIDSIDISEFIEES